MSKSERLQKIIAAAGICSRRQAEDLIREGSVRLNGKIAKIGDSAQLGEDSIKVHGKLLHAGSSEPPTYLLFHKPKGVVSMVSDDPQGRKTLKPYLKEIKQRIFPVGRLDFNGEGLLLLTNDGEAANQIQNSAQLFRQYEVKVKGYPPEEKLARLRKGAVLNGKRIVPSSLKVIKRLKSKVIIQIEFEAAGSLDVKELFQKHFFLVERVVRTRYGAYRLRNLPRGTYRRLEGRSVRALAE